MSAFRKGQHSKQGNWLNNGQPLEKIKELEEIQKE